MSPEKAVLVSDQDATDTQLYPSGDLGELPKQFHLCARFALMKIATLSRHECHLPLFPSVR